MPRTRQGHLVDIDGATGSHTPYPMAIVDKLVFTEERGLLIPSASYVWKTDLSS